MVNAPKVEAQERVKIPRKGPGRFQWQGAGWFGGQIGGSGWMLASAFVLGARSTALGIIWAACFVLANLVGCYMFLRRDRWLPYPCLQILLMTLGICGLIAWTSLVFMRIDLLPLMATKSPWTGYLALMIVPGLMLQFHWQESHPMHIQAKEEFQQGESDEC